ncbi:microtubule-associated protein SPIRAL2-like isoform X1 [Zea mays]|uniref:Microtubule-associated protein TORTIFOLIA1 n=1 Tax=Zea mays TaxID=4577 RepID=A0A804MRG3_MAIZE|nr:microtubule-associated protein SPIRAL2-like isoform X1 [Zea mays]|eukprot:XP_008670450.1 microtubule-associated protein SPIRAL2-like isoform X1 [Zea mays]
MATAVSKSAVKSHPRLPTTAQPPPPNPGSNAASAGGGAAPPPPPSPAAGATPSKNAAMAELKSRVLAALAKLSDRDTHHIAVEELDRIIRAPPSTDAVPMLLNALAPDSPGLASPARRECLRLLATLCTSHPDAAASHLHKVLAHLARRLKDPASDTSVRDTCRDVAGQLAAVYLRPLSASGVCEAGNATVTLFVKPLFEVMGEQSKSVQGGAAACLAKAVEGAGPGPGAIGMFGKLGPRICKLLGGQGVQAKAGLLGIMGSLAQVGAISSQNMQQTLQSIRDCLENSDWATRKAAADTLSVFATHSVHLIGDGTAPTIAALEACRFDKVRPVRDSMIDAVQLWKKLTGEDANADGRNKDLADGEGKLDSRRSIQRGGKSESFDDSSPDSPSNNVKGSSIAEKAAFLLKKRPTLTDRELNPEFFQKLETRKTDDLAVEVVVPHKTLQSHLRGEDETEEDDDPVGPADSNGSAEDEANLTQMRASFNFQNIRDKWAGQRGNRNKITKARTTDVEDRGEPSTKDSTAAAMNISGEGPFINNKTNWLAIQRQLSHLERQQTSLMNMLQDFMGGSHDSMVTLENRVRGLERVVEEMAREISLSSGRRGGGPALGFDSSPGRSSKHNGFHEYSNSKYGRSGDGRMGFAERYFSADAMASGTKNQSWRPDSEPWDSYAYSGSRSGMNVRRGLDSVSSDNRMARNERSNDQVGPRRGWDKGQGPFRFGEGPSARSAWRASKDEATLEAIRVAGEDNGNSRAAARVAIPELDGEALNDDNQGDERGPLWEAWTRAMDAVHLEDMDSAYAELLSTGDAELLVKLMEQTGPVVDQLSNEVANEVLHAVGQFLMEESLYDVALNWLQQLTDLVMENGSDYLGIPLDAKQDVLLGLHEATAIDLPDDWEGATPLQIMKQLASSWHIDLQQLIN